MASDTDRTFQVVITGDDKNGTVGITKADDADFVDAVQIVVLPAGETTVAFSLTPEANDGTEGFKASRSPCWTKASMPWLQAAPW